MKIGILQCGHAPGEVAAVHGDYAAMFRALLGGGDFDFEVWNVVDMAFPEGIHAAEGWLLTGSRHGAYDDLPFIPPLEAFIRAAYDAEVPMVGVCFGHQIIAQALGGKVIKYPGGWSIGRHDYVLDGIGRVALNAWHQDQVVELPEGAEPAGLSDNCRLAAIRYGDRAWTIQPHPEFSPDVMRDYLGLRRDGGYPAGIMERAEAELPRPLDRDKVGAHIAGFFAAARARRREAAS